MIHYSGDREIDRLFLDEAIEIGEDQEMDKREFEHWLDERPSLTPEEVEDMHKRMMEDLSKAMEKNHGLHGSQKS